MKIKEKKFETVFKILIVAFTVSVMLAHTIMLYNAKESIEKSNLDYLTSVSNGIEYDLRSRTETLERAATVLSNRAIPYLSAKDENERTLEYRRIEDKVYELSKDGSRFSGGVIIDSVGNVTTIGGADEEDALVAKENYPLFKSGVFHDGVSFCLSNGVLFLYKYVDVLKYNLTFAGIDNMGTIVIIDKINLLEWKMRLNILDSIDASMTLKDNADSFLQIFSKSEEYPQHMFTKSFNLAETAWNINVKMYDKYISFGYLTAYNGNIVLILITIVFIVIFVFVFSRMYTRPMLRLTKYMRDYSLGGKSEVITDVGVAEFNSLLKHINEMFVCLKNDAHKIVHTQEMLYEEELEKQKILLYMYQLQIQPHFLYNTLGCINYFALEHNAHEIVEMIEALTGILRYSAETSIDSSMKKELTYTQWYMKIIKMRYPDKVDLRIDVDDELLEIQLPSMSLQPIVENAFKHGILMKNGKGIIQIKGYIEGEHAYIQIHDNGVGMSEEQCQALNNKQDISGIRSDEPVKLGLANVKKRLKLKFGENSSLTVKSKQNEYTTISIKIKI